MGMPTAPRYNSMADFFAPDVFQAVLKDPATAIRLKAFCESSACGENIAFLEKADQYRRLLDQAQELLYEIHETYTSPDATEPINISENISKDLISMINTATDVTIPAMQDVFSDARRHVEGLMREDVYPRFVKHQITASATIALSQDRSAYQGLGDCFCLTDPKVADNAILYASDGFVNVTGYSRRDIVPRNCRFLQGAMTDRSSVTRLKSSIENGQESVELILNYRKDGTPFWNLLYVAPLRDESGNIVFFLGGQIDCSTTIHGNPDVLQILGFDDRQLRQPHGDDLAVKDTSSSNGPSSSEQPRRQRHMFRLSSGCFTEVKHGAGMEDDLVGKLGHMSLATQKDVFQTAYSKYLVLKVNDRAGFDIAHYSTFAAGLLHLSRTRETRESIVNKEIFKVLAKRSPSSSYVLKSYKKAVTDCLTRGKAVSVDFEALVEEKSQESKPIWPVVKTIQQLVTHWTPCKDQDGRAKYIVLVFAER